MFSLQMVIDIHINSHGTIFFVLHFMDLVLPVLCLSCFGE